MDGFFGAVKLGIVCMTVLAVLWGVGMSLPKSRLRSYMTEITSWAFLAFCILYGVSPLDIVPDVFFPVGFIDDAGALFGGFQAYRSAMDARRERQLLDY